MKIHNGSSWNYLFGCYLLYLPLYSRLLHQALSDSTVRFAAERRHLSQIVVTTEKCISHFTRSLWKCCLQMSMWGQGIFRNYLFSLCRTCVHFLWHWNRSSSCKWSALYQNQEVLYHKGILIAPKQSGDARALNVLGQWNQQSCIESHETLLNRGFPKSESRNQYEYHNNGIWLAIQANGAITFSWNSNTGVKVCNMSRGIQHCLKYLLF